MTGTATVRHVESTGKREPVLNLIVERDHSFVADDVVANSFTVLPRTRGLIADLRAWLAKLGSKAHEEVEAGPSLNLSK